MPKAGVNLDDVADLLAVADGCVTGTHFKAAGDPWQPVDGERVKRFMARVRELR